jgi:hypothetical protein
VTEASHQGAIGPTGEVADILFGLCWQQATATGQRLEKESRWSSQEGHLALYGGGTIRRRSCDSKSGNVGVRYRAVGWDEVCRSKNGRRLWFQDFRPTLSGFEGEALWITTPSGWDHVHDLASRIIAGREPDWGYVEAASWENEYLYPLGRNDPGILAAEREYEEAGVPELFRQEYGAEFTILSGVVFRKWNPKEMVVPHVQACQGIVQWFLGYDWGWQKTHPTVWALIGRTGGGQWRVVDEDYDTGEAPEDILARAAILLHRNNLSQSQIERIYYDPSRPEQGAMFRRAGYAATKADYGLPERILAVGGAIGKPGGFLVSDRCKQIPVELTIYRHRDDNSTGNLQVVKLQDDGVDAVAGVLASVRQSDARSTADAVGYAQPRGTVLIAPHRRIR